MMCFSKEKLPIILRLLLEKELFKRKRLKLENVTFKKYILMKNFQEEKIVNKELRKEQRFNKSAFTS